MLRVDAVADRQMIASKYNRSWLVVSLLSWSTILYALFPTHDYYWDGILFAQNIEDAGGGSPLLFHPNHLLYSWIGWLAYCAVGTVHHVRALYVLQALNIAFAGAAIFVMMNLFQKLGLSPRAQACFTALFAFSVTWWRFATDADAYILSTLLLILAFQILQTQSDNRYLVCALFQVAAIAVHELAVLFAPVVLFAIVRERRPWPWTLKQLSLYILATGGAAGLLYLTAYRFVGPFMGNPGLWRWMTSHSHDSSFSFGILANTIATIKSYLRLFAGGRPGLLGGHFAGPVVIVSITAGALIAIGFIVASWRLPNYSNEREEKDATRVATECSVIWLISYGVFLFFWLPNNTFYKLFVLPPIVILIALQWSARTRHHDQRRAKALTIAVAALFLANFVCAILPYSLVGSELVQFSRSLRDVLPAHSVVLYSEFVPDDWYMRYFSPQASWIRVHSLAEIRANYVAAKQRGGTVWAEATAAALLKQAHIEFSQDAASEELRERNGAIMLQRIDGIP